MGYLRDCCNEGIITMDDPHKKFNFNNFTLKDVRCWKKEFHSPDPNYWKFNSYKINHDAGNPFMNNKSGHNKGECELCCCLDNYKSDPIKGGELIKNNRFTMWIGYKY